MSRTRRVTEDGNRRPEAAPGDAGRPVVAVFGASDPAPGSAAYEEAADLGLRLAAAGCDVINGGYGGVMEASARGAREAGGRAIGVTTLAFRARGGANPFIDTEHREVDLFDRTRRLIETAAAFIILRGRAGTLAELAFLWALRKAGLLGPKPIVLVGEFWDEVLRQLRRSDLIAGQDLAGTRVVRSPEMAVEAVTRALRDTR
jgi:hypothetical protein